MLWQKRKVRPVRVVDIPEHSQLRPKLDEYLPQAAAIVFVVDAVDFLSNCHSPSEYMYDILTNRSVVEKKILLLILCNKIDKVTAHSKEFICFMTPSLNSASLMITLLLHIIVDCSWDYMRVSLGVW